MFDHEVSPEEYAPPRRSRWETVREHPLFVVLPVGLLAALGVVGALVYSAASPHLYASDAVIRAYNPYRVSGQQFGQVDAATIVTIEQRYAESHATERAAEAAMNKDGTAYDHVVWTAQPAAATLTVRCFATEAADSTACASAFADTYVTSRSAAIARPLRSQVAQMTAASARLSRQVQTLQKRIDSEVGPEGRATDANRGRLAQQSALLAQISQIQADRQEASSQAQTLVQNYQVVAAPEKPDALATPLTRRNAAVGLVAGVLLGVALWLLLARPRGRRRV